MGWVISDNKSVKFCPISTVVFSNEMPAAVSAFLKKNDTSNLPWLEESIYFPYYIDYLNFKYIKGYHEYCLLESMDQVL